VTVKHQWEKLLGVKPSRHGHGLLNGEPNVFESGSKESWRALTQKGRHARVRVWADTYHSVRGQVADGDRVTYNANFH
jgi:hypothetical protein